MQNETTNNKTKDNVSEKDMFHLTTIVRIDVYFSVFQWTIQDGDTPTAIEI